MYSVYKVTNKINGKIYIGVHKSIDINDDYKGSGLIVRQAHKKYGKENFDKEIIKTFETKEEAYFLEKSLVDKDFILLDTNYNIKLGGEGGWDFINKNGLNIVSCDEVSAKISKTQKERYAKGAEPWIKGKKLPGHGLKSKATRISNGGSYAGKNNPMYGKSVKDFMTNDAIKEWGDKISKSNTGKVRSEESKQKYSENAKSRKWLIHISGKKSSTIDINDPRLSSPEWQLGRVWK